MIEQRQTKEKEQDFPYAQREYGIRLYDTYKEELNRRWKELKEVDRIVDEYKKIETSIQYIESTLRLFSLRICPPRIVR